VKPLAKSLARVIARVLLAPLWLTDWALQRLGSDAAFVASSQLLSLLPGKTGSYLRIAYFRGAMQHCAGDCFIGFGTLFAQRDTHIGSGVYIGPQCNIGACRIEADTLIASGVHVMSGTKQHAFADLDMPIRDQGGEYLPIRIGRDCWIGNGALVMADIGDQCVIGAGSVVTEPVPPRSIAVGNPARVLRSREPSPAEPSGSPRTHGDR